MSDLEFRRGTPVSHCSPRHFQLFTASPTDLPRKAGNARLRFVESTNSADTSTPLSDAARQAVAQICAQITEDLPAISHEMVRRIRAEIPEYAFIPAEEHQQFVLYQGRMLLAGIAE